MIIYNKTWLTNQRLHNELEMEMQQGRIIADELTVIKAKYPVGFYTPNIFVRAGLFILTVIIVSFADGLLSLMASGVSIKNTGGWFIFLGLFSYIALEMVVHTYHHRCSGVDDALLISAGCSFIVGFGYFTYNQSYTGIAYLPLSGFACLLALYFTLRFNDMLAAVIGSMSLFAFFFLLWKKIGFGGLATAPFLIMLVSGAAYWFARAYAKQRRFINYQNCLTIAQILSLIVLYAAGNYYIIQTLGNDMKGLDRQTNTPVPFGAFFWGWTILLPFIYTGIGIRKKDVILLRTGVALIAAAIFTFRNYYHLLPTDLMLTIGGAVVLGIVYAVTNYLKTPKHGFTREDLGEADAMDALKVESLIVAQTFSHPAQAPADNGVKYGGGDFGGGGSSGGY